MGADMQLEDVFAKVLNTPAASFTDDTSQDNLGAWTSLRNVTLLVALEEKYGVRFSNAEMTTMRSVGDIRRALTKKGASVT
jgi:acyl carrier protein